MKCQAGSRLAFTVSSGLFARLQSGHELLKATKTFDQAVDKVFAGFITKRFFFPSQRYSYVTAEEQTMFLSKARKKKEVKNIYS